MNLANPEAAEQKKRATKNATDRRKHLDSLLGFHVLYCLVTLPWYD
jgi:hypothetical protein